MRLLLIAFLVGVFSPTAYSLEPTQEELDDLFAFRGIVYRQDDDGQASGNPHIREDALIYEGIFLLQKRVSDENAARVKLTGDLVTAASYDDARERAETVSEATGYNPGRWNIDLGWVHSGRDGFKWGVHAAYGQEFAYRSSNVGFNLGKSLAEDAAQISLSYQYFDDTVRVIRWDGSKEADEQRLTSTLNLSWTQALSANSIANVGLSYTQQDGFLSTSFNSVRIGSEIEFERLPDQRSRTAISARYKYAWPRDSIQLGYSYYEDDWEIRAHTAELRYFWHLGKDSWRLEPSYRFYSQSAADYFAFEFDDIQLFQTSDPDLGRLDGHSFGILSSFRGPSWFTDQQAHYDIGISYYDRSDGLDFYWLTLGWRFAY
jgi:hypothetical protein